MASPIADRCEFLSDQWLNEAHSFLSNAVSAMRDEIGDASFVLVERFTDTPPHLPFPANARQICTTVDRQGGHMSTDIPPHADQTIVVDYQAALSVAGIVGSETPGEMERAFRETLNMYGPESVKISGNAPPPAIARVLGRLHDHMARRTVENPDLTHRAARQGLTAKIAEYQENGFTVLERAITPEFADELRETLLKEIMPYDHLQSHGMLMRGRIFELMVQHPLLRTLVEAVLGRGAIIASLAGIHKAAGKGLVPLHTDYTLIPAPYPEYGLTAVAVWALEDWTIEAGPTWVMPGSHRKRRYPTEKDVPSGGVPILMPKGSVTFFGSGVWHWQGDRSAEGARVTLHAQYTRGFIRPLDSLDLEPHILDRNGPAFSELTGKDDPFEKSGVFGHDMARWRHMENLMSLKAFSGSVSRAEASKT